MNVQNAAGLDAALAPVTVRELQSWNNMGGSTALRAGQSLTIHVGGGSGIGG